MKEFKVYLFAHENDDYNEIWKVKNKDKYFARHTYYGGEWYFVSDAPYGYCELVTLCPDDYCFIVCTKRGKELFRSTNADATGRFPSLRQKCIDEWNKVRSKHPNVSREGQRQWLGEFLTPEIKERLMADPLTNVCIEDNFCYCWYDCIESEKISSFSHLGVEHCITRNKMQSRYNPEAVWYFYQGADGYYAGWEPVSN